MKLQIFKTVILTLLIAVVLFFGNKLILQTESFSQNFEVFSYSLETIYALFCAFSVIILITLMIVNSRNKDIVGMTFLLITSIKAGVLFFIFSDIIGSSNKNTVERINFFVVFILFLTIETLITIRLLNKKQ
ncbi:DUF6168 family protein [Flavobacterium aquatile]|uniref:DUF6168 family protein n=1 Tax=Flavobacterium aquatile TaxID=245 RepID=UPI000B69710B|nr:DUF6168 family protein [Flavobacterium aquatile]OXA69221.1 hypothetical protein B0A61_01550 [Flavobacterium aquatile LMG 4008 = ATCC 11947]